MKIYKKHNSFFCKNMTRGGRGGPGGTSRGARGGRAGGAGDPPKRGCPPPGVRGAKIVQKRGFLGVKRGKNGVFWGQKCTFCALAKIFFTFFKKSCFLV